MNNFDDYLLAMEDLQVRYIAGEDKRASAMVDNSVQRAINFMPD